MQWILSIGFDPRYSLYKFSVRFMWLNEPEERVSESEAAGSNPVSHFNVFIFINIFYFTSKLTPNNKLSSKIHFLILLLKSLTNKLGGKGFVLV